ncbi:IQ calmodulin-binding motif-containing protein 1 isoform X1 [Petaurus breviceps papuanus]|uniref:IQ calmodulin-binding motif-containing protein 1 isoform X1 n=1 Tax=Petaurus breviceps papuanus TaxID=3040969 RepID=UPI0036DBA88E
MESIIVDPRILTLATEITESPEQNVPVIMLKLKEILNSAPLGSSELKKIKQDIYCYDLIQYCLLVLRKDVTKIQGGWMTISQLAQIVSQCCVGLEPTEDAEEFYNKLLPSAAENFLVLGRRLQKYYISALEDEEKDKFLLHFQSVIDSLCWLLRGHIQLTKYACWELSAVLQEPCVSGGRGGPDQQLWEQTSGECSTSSCGGFQTSQPINTKDKVKVLQSDHFLHLFLTDDVETGSAVMNVLQNILQVKSGDLLMIKEKALHSILDELVFKLSSSTSLVIGSVAIKLLLLMAKSQPEIMMLLRSRYTGLKSMLSKQWSGKEIDQELKQLLSLLSSEGYQEEDQKFYQAACKIQAAWKGFQTRKRMKKLPYVVTTLQRNFRNKREQQLLKLKKQKEEEDLRLQLQLQRHRAIRISREHRLNLLEIVHPGQMGKHIQEMEEKSALIIQKHWRGYRERKNFHQQKQSLKEYKAAVILQRAALKFLRKCQKKKKMSYSWRGLPELTDARRMELKQHVDDYIKRHSLDSSNQETQGSEMSDVASRELHTQAQERLGHYLLGRALEGRAQQRREALQAQISTNIEQLMSAPHLRETTGQEPELFISRSRPVATRAKQAHLATLIEKQSPWWKKLGDEVEDEEVIPKEALNIDLGTLFIGGSKSP